MARVKLTAKDLRNELNDFRERFPRLSYDQLFLLWFLRVFVTENENDAALALTGGAKDKGVDAVLVDDRTKSVFVAQGKYREKIAAKSESRPDVLSFAQIAVDLCGANESFGRFSKDLSPEVLGKIVDARKRIRNQSYRLQLYYVTTGKCSRPLVEEARRVVRSAELPSSIEVISGQRVLLLLADYLDGVAPPVPSLDLDMEAGAGVKLDGVLQRYDRKTDIESWVFPMAGASVAGLFEAAGVRLFARNVRGFLGSTDINRGMETTLEKEPEYFWYYNNGITVVCDYAEEVRSGGKNVLRVTNPQIINGQQTTRTLAKFITNGTRASVLVRVIRVPRVANGESGENDRFESLISKIVAATNWQNEIRPSDLMSNDRRQIQIERELRKLGYWYVRKRQTKSEARKFAGKHLRLIRKEDLAQAVAACDLDPGILREGKERLFEERLYNQVFPTGDPFYYLIRYRLLREVNYRAHGYPERAYAKWVVLNFIWAKLAPLVRARAAAEIFRQTSEKNVSPIGYLSSAIDKVFVASLKFYRAKRGKGATALDVSTFFHRRNLDEQFENFWSSPKNTARSGYNRYWKRFQGALIEELAR
jgi:hypothetical protein